MVIAENRDIAQRLDETAALLHEQGANPFRVRAYRRAAETVRSLREPAPAILAREGVESLEALPAIGEQLAEHIRTLAETGRLPMLDRLRGAGDPETLLSSIPGIGKKGGAIASRTRHRHVGGP